MTPTQRKLCQGLIMSPRGETQISKEEFLRQFPSSLENGKLRQWILDEAYGAKNAEDVQCALTIGHKFAFGAEHIRTLSKLIDVDWHYSHEDVVSALEDL